MTKLTQAGLVGVVGVVVLAAATPALTKLASALVCPASGRRDCRHSAALRVVADRPEVNAYSPLEAQPDSLPLTEKSP